VRKLLLHTRILLCMGALCLGIGFMFASSSPDKVFVGIAFYIISLILFAVSLILSIKYNKLSQEESNQGRFK